MTLNMEDHGGLKMLDLLESMILARRTMNWKKIFEGYAFELLFRKSGRKVQFPVPF